MLRFGVKQCSLCEEEKSLMDFYQHAGRGTYYSVCRKCHNARTSANPKARYFGRRDNLMRRFGITPEQYEQMHRAQNGLCAICERPEVVFDRRLAVDHSHETGEIRGLLCHSCNTGVGKLQDNPELLRKAADYLERHRNGRSNLYNGG